MLSIFEPSNFAIVVFATIIGCVLLHWLGNGSDSNGRVRRNGKYGSDSGTSYDCDGGGSDGGD